MNVQEDALVAGHTQVAANSRPRRGDVRIGSTRPDPLRHHWGKYVPIRILGTGGMGWVLLAYDPVLDRKVALKILAPTLSADTSEGAPLEELYQRLASEARVLARLAHPHVVTAFDVGVCDGQVYLAMDYIEGITLRKWMTSAQRSLAARLNVLAQAASALEAAHEAAIIHRDFKPDNVLVDINDRAVVVDFGIARDLRPQPMEVASTPVDLLERRAAKRRKLSGKTVQEVSSSSTSGLVLGTPRYMSPEQAAGEECGPQSDCYAFALCAFEVLVGRHPAEILARSRGWDERGLRKIEGLLPAELRGPLRRALTTSLRVDPKARPATIHELGALLLEAKERITARSQRRTSLGLGALALTGVVAFGVAIGKNNARGEEAQICDDGLATWNAVWNPEREAELHEKFRDTGLTFAEETWQRVVQGLNIYRQGWLQDYAQICAQAHRATWDQTLDLRMACLGQARTRAHALIFAWQSARDPNAAVSSALQALAELPRLTGCAFDDGDDSSFALPSSDDPRRKLIYEAWTQTMSRAQGFDNAGQYEQAFEEMQAILPALAADHSREGQIFSAHFESLLGRIYVHRGELVAAGVHLDRAMLLGRALGQVLPHAQAGIELAFARGYLQGARDEGMNNLAEVQGLVISRKDLLELRTLWFNNLGLLHWVAREHRAARSAMETGLAMTRQEYGEPSLQVSILLTNLALVDASDHELLRAIADSVAALHGYTHALGSNHPVLAVTQSNLGILYRYIGDFAQAVRYGRDSIRSCNSSRPQSVLTCAFVYSESALSLERAGHVLQAGLQLWQLAVAQENAGQRGHPAISWATTDASSLALNHGATRLALVLARHGHRQMEMHQEVFPEMRARALRVLADAELALGQIAAAQAHIAQASALLRQEGPEVEYHRPDVLRTVSEVAWSSGDWRAAWLAARAALAGAQVIYTDFANPNLVPFVRLLERMRQNSAAELAG